MWGATSAAAQFVTMAMFVQSFWFGTKLVRDGKIGAGNVVAVFGGVFGRNEHSG
jgi:hypothetical protein